MLVLDDKKAYQVLGIDISPYSKDEFFRLVDARLADKDPASPSLFVVTVNPEIVIESIIDNDFKDILSTSSINTADGIGISWAINFLYGKRVDRITGSDSMEKICAICARHSESVFFYGAMPSVAEKTAAILKDKIKDLEVAGTYSPERPDLPLDELPYHIKDKLDTASVIFVALGAPAQEKWIHTNLPKLTNCKIIIGIGGSFDYMTGQVKRAPKWLRRLGLEWLYRLLLQPSRWRRMLKLPLFALNVLILKSSSGNKYKLPETD